MEKGHGVEVGQGSEADSLQGLARRVAWLEADVKRLKEELELSRRPTVRPPQLVLDPSQRLTAQERWRRNGGENNVP